MKAPKRGSRNTLKVFKNRLDMAFMDVHQIIFIRTIINNVLIFGYSLYKIVNKQLHCLQCYFFSEITHRPITHNVYKLISQLFGNIVICFVFKFQRMTKRILHGCIIVCNYLKIRNATVILRINGKTFNVWLLKIVG